MNASSIRWRPWDRASFDEAERADKPILLRLSAVWCHWCHVMDETSDREPEAIRRLNEDYVPIRVDIDKHPDVRERYNFGGYPTSAFLTPSGEILTGGTYIPPDQFVQLLGQVSQAYRENKSDLLARIKSFHREHAAHARPAAAPEAAAAALQTIEAVEASILGNFDERQGGFGSAPKFPQAAAISVALASWRSTREPQWERVVAKTLEAMRHAALWDREEKGFYRYSVKSDWSEPHFEKMLETNAGLLLNYAQVGAALARPDLVNVAKETRDYLRASLQDSSNGLFYGSQDADEAYSALGLAERRAREAPFVDRTFYTDWNAQMIHAYLQAYASTGDAAWLQDGTRALDSLLRLCHVAGRGMKHYYADGAAHGEDLLSDQAHTLRALVLAHALTGRETYAKAARDVASVALEKLWSNDDLQFFDRAPTAPALGLLAKPQTPIADNGVMAQALVRLERLGVEGAREKAASIVRSAAPTARRYGLFASEAALAARMLLEPELVVHVVGPADATVSLIQEAARIPYGNAWVECHPDGRADAVAKEFEIGRIEAPAAFACVEKACSRLFRPGESFAAEAAQLVRPRLRAS